MSQQDEDREMQEKLGISDKEMQGLARNDRQQDRNNKVFGKSWSDQGREARRMQQEVEREGRRFAEQQVRERAVSQPAPAAQTVQTSSTILASPAPPPRTKKGGEHPAPVEIVKHKPFAFALEYDSSGAKCYFGNLIVSFTYATATYNVASTPAFAVTQVEVAQPTVYPATNLNTVDNWSYKPTKLNFFGDVWLKWECDSTGVMDASSVEVVGPEEPELEPIPEYPFMGTPPSPCLYYVKIGSVESDGTVTQILSADFYWTFHLMRGGGTTVPPGP